MLVGVAQCMRSVSLALSTHMTLYSRRRSRHIMSSTYPQTELLGTAGGWLPEVAHLQQSLATAMRLQNCAAESTLIVSQIAVQCIRSEVCGGRCYCANIFTGPSDVPLERRTLEGHHVFPQLFTGLSPISIPPSYIGCLASRRGRTKSRGRESERCALVLTAWEQ